MPFIERGYDEQRQINADIYFLCIQMVHTSLYTHANAKFSYFKRRRGNFSATITSLRKFHHFIQNSVTAHDICILNVTSQLTNEHFSQYGTIILQRQVIFSSIYWAII